MNRRTFLQVGTLGLGSLSSLTPTLYASQEKSHKKSVIFIFLAGGMTHAESFNAALDSKDRYRSVTGYIPTKSDFHLAGNWTKLAQSSNLFSVVHSFTHTNAGHQSGTNWVNTGYNFTDENPGAIQTHPSFGSIVAKQYGSNNEKTGIPNYVSTGKLFGQHAAYLGAAYNPFSVDEEGKKNLGLNIDEMRFTQRYNALLQLDSKFKNIKSLSINDEHKKQAYDIMFGAASKVFNLELEPKHVRDKYGDKPIAKNCLLARRLVESGTKFVTITHGGWDMHAGIKNGMNNLVPEVDHAISTLLADLNERGLLDSTLVIVSTEFGRTAINKDDGRDHYPGITPLLLSGGNYVGGKTIGEMDTNGFAVKSNPFYPINLLSTVLNHMEIPTNIQFTDFSGRPRFILEGQDKRVIND